MIVITTYQRPRMCKRLIKQIRAQFDGEIWVYDDGSTEDYTEIRELADRYVKTRNHGKKEYWKLINRIFSDLEGVSFDYVVKLDDDLQLVDRAIPKAVQLFESLPNPKYALNILADSRLGKPSWTGIKSVKCGEYWRTGWVDMIWMANRDFFKALEWEIREPNLDIWKENPLASSQVGKQISLRLCSKGAFYQVNETLVTHGQHESQMNPIERKINPL